MYMIPGANLNFLGASRLSPWKKKAESHIYSYRALNNTDCLKATHSN